MEAAPMRRVRGRQRLAAEELRARGAVETERAAHAQVLPERAAMVALPATRRRAARAVGALEAQVGVLAANRVSEAKVALRLMAPIPVRA
jgi:hypothetical protein